MGSAVTCELYHVQSTIIHGQAPRAGFGQKPEDQANSSSPTNGNFGKQQDIGGSDHECDFSPTFERLSPWERIFHWRVPRNLLYN
jgi:hypothetical protein